MVTKTKKAVKQANKTPAITHNPKAILVQGFIGDTKDRAIAHSLTCPSTQAASTIHTFEKSEYDINGFVEELSAQVEAVHSCNMKRAEAMLITQAHTLNELFNSLARRACNQDYLLQYETYMRIALKAQNQCRSTLEALATIKNPPVIFAKQANIAHGHQQINNATPAPASHAGENLNQPNELLTEETQNGTAMDISGAGATSGIDSELEAVEGIDRG